MKFEIENTVYKRIVTDDIYKSVIAFANTSGGTIYVGVDDDGEAVGIEDIDDVYTRLTYSVSEIIAHDVTMFTKHTLHDNGTISIEVAEGASKSYYIKSNRV